VRFTNQPAAVALPMTIGTRRVQVAITTKSDAPE
jgi:hypothetical protein